MSLQRRIRRFRAIHVAELPAGWLGKPHALQQAYEASSGEWLLFTDADVRFKPDVVRRAIAMATERKLDHLRYSATWRWWASGKRC